MKLETKNNIQLNFFNTINLEGSELKGARESCNRQEERILRLIRWEDKPVTPFEVQRIYNEIYDEIPITSIRRAMTCLTKKGKLEKLDEMKEGAYGRVNHKWKIK